MVFVYVKKMIPSLPYVLLKTVGQLLLLLLLLFLAAPHSMWDLSSPTRDQTWATYSGSLDHWTARAAP